MPELQDILDYLTNQLRSAGESARQSSQLGGRIADQYIAGKRPGDTSEFANEVIGMNPVTGGVIAPTANPMLKSLWEQLKNAAPKVYKAAQDDPRTLFSYLVNPRSMPTNASGTYRGIKSTLHPEIPSQSGEAYVNAAQRSSEYLPTLLHETGHFVTEPLLKSKNPEHALETAMQFAAMMPEAQAKAMRQYLPSQLMMPNISKRLRNNDQAQLAHAGSAYNEARSYLQESLLQPTNQGGDPMLSLIADALGLGLR